MEPNEPKTDEQTPKAPWYEPKTDEQTPKAPWYESPTFKHLAGVALAIVLGLLASRFGIAPQPLPTLPYQPQAQSPVVLVFAGGPQPGQPVSVAEAK